MIDLNTLMLFAKIVEAQSFSEAARRLNMPISTISRKIADLEEQLAVRLLERSTRSLRLTDVGAELLEHAQRTVELSEAVDGIVSNQLTEVYGMLKLSAPPSLSESLLIPLISAFQASYPEVRFRTFITDRFVDHIAEGIDLVFRVGELKDSSLTAKRLLHYRHQLVASPDYLAQHTLPKDPRDLLDHKLLAFSHGNADNSWTFLKDGKAEKLSFRPYIAMNDFIGLLAALKSGLGIGDLPPIVAPESVCTHAEHVHVVALGCTQTNEFANKRRSIFLPIFERGNLLCRRDQKK